MSLDAVYADGIEEGLTRWAANPGPAPETSFSVTSFLGAGTKGLPSGALEASGSAADLLSAVGTASAASGGSAGGMFSTPTEAEQKQEADARKKMLEGNSFDFTAGNALRRKASEFAPDPLTSHAADQVVHGLTRFAGKAIAATALAGPTAGAVLLGMEEGNTAAQNLRMEGVDDVTAAKVGAVQGVTAAIGVRIPMAGKTVTQTIGLVGAGGPGSFMAQEALSRRILEQAGYNDQASLHNPFDPLGLALSTVIPGAFGALHMRSVRRTALEQVVEHIESGGQRYGKDGQLLTSPKGAQGEMQVMPDTAGDPGYGVTPARDNSPEELARVGRDYLGAMSQRYGDSDKALAAYNAGPGAVDKAIAAHGDDWLKHLPRETQEYVHKANALGARHVAQEAAKTPENVDAARVSALNDTVQRSLPDTPDAYAQVQRAADIVGESGGRAAERSIAPVRDIDLHTFREWFGESKAVDEKGEPVVMYHGTGSDVAAFDPNRPGPHTDMGAVFVTADPQVASHYANVGALFGDKAPNVVPVYVSAKNPFDYANAAHRAAVVDRVMETGETHTQGDGQKALVLDGKKTLYTKDVLDAGLAEGSNWDLIERKVVQDAIKHQGHDGFYVNEDSKNLAVYDAAQLKSAIGNSGKFDRNSTSLTDPLRPGEVSPRDGSNALPPPDSVTLAGDESAKRGTEVGAPQEAQEPAKAAGGAGEPAATIDQQLAARIATEQPELQVTLPGSDERLTVAEAMARIAEEQKQDAQWADLVKVAAECALGA